LLLKVLSDYTTIPPRWEFVAYAKANRWPEGRNAGLDENQAANAARQVARQLEAAQPFDIARDPAPIARCIRVMVWHCGTVALYVLTLSLDLLYAFSVWRI
jgi:hypothetical protein